jgi:hypothetical protein
VTGLRASSNAIAARGAGSPLSDCGLDRPVGASPAGLGAPHPAPGPVQSEPAVAARWGRPDRRSQSPSRRRCWSFADSRYSGRCKPVAAPRRFRSEACGINSRRSEGAASLTSPFTYSPNSGCFSRARSPVRASCATVIPHSWRRSLPEPVHARFFIRLAQQNCVG